MTHVKQTPILAEKYLRPNGKNNDHYQCTDDIQGQFRLNTRPNIANKYNNEHTQGSQMQENTCKVTENSHISESQGKNPKSKQLKPLAQTKRQQQEGAQDRQQIVRPRPARISRIPDWIVLHCAVIPTSIIK